MLVIYGRYRWFPKNVAFRNDYCLHCDEPVLAVRERTFDVLHLFWLPLIPIGFWRKWFCSQCSRPPSLPPRTRKPFKWAGLVLLAMAAWTFWLAPLETWDPDLDTDFLWTMRVLIGVGLPLLLWNVLRAPKDVSYREMQRTVAPYRGLDCPLCGRRLSLGAVRYCQHCGLERAESP